MSQISVTAEHLRCQFVKDTGFASRLGEFSADPLTLLFSGLIEWQLTVTQAGTKLLEQSKWEEGAQGPLMDRLPMT